MLVAIAVIGVVGGVLANKSRQELPYFSTDANGTCTVQVNLFSTTTDDQSVDLVPYSSIANPNGGCETRLIEFQ